MRTEQLAEARSLHPISIDAIFFGGLRCLVLRIASCLDAFSTYRYNAWLLGLLITTDTLEASDFRSSRTRKSFHSDNNTPSRYHTNCLTTFLTQLTIPFNM